MADEVNLFDRGRARLEVFLTDDQCAEYLSREFWSLQRLTVRQGRPFVVALSGGRTPAGFYRMVGREGSQEDWQSINVFLVDERYVPLTSSESNYRMIKENLLDVAPIPAANIHPIETHEQEPQTSARRYEKCLSDFFADLSLPTPTFDFVLLGLGTDGHTASLFPGSPTLPDSARLAIVTTAPDGMVRISLTFKAINEGRRIFFLATGNGKAEVVRRLLAEKDPDLPASHVRPTAGTIAFVCDRLAASLLEEQEIEGMVSS